jgi:hypothetical protein
MTDYLDAHSEYLEQRDQVETHEYKEEPFYYEPIGEGEYELYVSHKSFITSVVKVKSTNRSVLRNLAYGYLACDDEVRGIDFHRNGRFISNIRLLGNGKYQVHQGNGQVDIAEKDAVLEWIAND